MSDQFQVFLTDEACQINKARLQHLASLNLDLVGKRVLEVGAGIGLHTHFFEQRGCSVVSTDARLENVLEMRRLYPHRWVEVLDLDALSDFSYLGQFDIVFCYGTLYHLCKPEQSIQAMAQVCKGMLLLETCVTPGEELEIYLESEDLDNPNQAKSGLGCRPTRPWIMSTMQKYFNCAYVTKYQPHSPDFDLDWQNPIPKKLHRAVFIGAKKPILNPKLLNTLPTYQNYDPDAKKVWIDVGAHLGQTSFEKARDDPTLTVYAFEPNLRLAAQLFAALPNYIVLPFAVSSCSGFSNFYINQNDATSSLQAFNPEGVKEWILGEQLQLEIVTSVPTIRLDSFLAAFNIQIVDYLKVDAQGADLEVIQSLGDRLQDVSRIQMEVAITPVELYVNAHSKQEVIDFFKDKNFIIVAAIKQSFAQEENLILMRRDKIQDIADLEKIVDHLLPEAVVPVAEAFGVSRPLHPYPLWRSHLDQELVHQDGVFRRSLWEKLISQSQRNTLPFRWYRQLHLSLDLTSEVDRQLFIDQCYRPNEFCVLDTLLLPGMTVVDTEVDQGLYALFAAACVGDRGQVVACTANPKEGEHWQQSLALNHLTHGKTYLSPAGDLQADFSLSLEAVVQEYALTRIDLIKSRFPPTSCALSQSAKPLLNQFRPVLLLELASTVPHEATQDETALLNTLGALGYKIFTIGALTGLPLPWHKGNPIYSSLIAIHPHGVRNDLITQYAQNETMELARLQRELEWTRAELQQTRSTLEQCRNESQLQLEQLQTQNTQLTEQVSRSQTEIDELSQNLLTLKTQLEQATAHVEWSQKTVQAMESSKFWRLRMYWMKIKRFFRLTTDHE